MAIVDRDVNLEHLEHLEPDEAKSAVLGWLKINPDEYAEMLRRLEASDESILPTQPR